MHVLITYNKENAKNTANTFIFCDGINKLSVDEIIDHLRLLFPSEPSPIRSERSHWSKVYWFGTGTIVKNDSE